MAGATERQGARARRVLVGLLVMWVALMGALSWFLAASQARARRDTAQRLAARTASGAEFSSLSVQDIFAREREQAKDALAARRVSRAVLEHEVSDGGFSAAVLLDRRGRVLQAVPTKPGLLGQDITGRYPHLAAAVAGRAAVSNVVPSAARGVPVVAFAVPFATPSGPRVFSAAYNISKTPLGAYVRHVIVVPGRRVYLVDAAGRLLATSGARLRGGETLVQLDPQLAGHVRRRESGSYSASNGRQFFVSAAVPDTPWRIVVAVPEAELYSSVNGATRWLAWVAVASLAIAGLVILMLGSRLVRSRTRLAMLNGELDRLARVDSLTGLRNRRDIEERLVGTVSATQRRDQSLAVLLIDIDHFKPVNDTFGHQAGDGVLVRTAQTMQSVLRTEDILSRWGGEEFLAVLPDTNDQGALVVAERLRAHVAKRGPQDADGPGAVTVTIGVAAWSPRGMDDLLSRADAALYAGKAAGRNNVQLAPAELPRNLVSA